MQSVTAAKDESGRLIPRLKTLEETNEALRVELAVASGRSSKAELELAQVRPLSSIFFLRSCYFSAHDSQNRRGMT